MSQIKIKKTTTSYFNLNKIEQEFFNELCRVVQNYLKRNQSFNARGHDVWSSSALVYSVALDHQCLGISHVETFYGLNDQDWVSITRAGKNMAIKFSKMGLCEVDNRGHLVSLKNEFFCAAATLVED